MVKWPSRLAGVEDYQEELVFINFTGLRHRNIQNPTPPLARQAATLKEALMETLQQVPKMVAGVENNTNNRFPGAKSMYVFYFFLFNLISIKPTDPGLNTVNWNTIYPQINEKVITRVSNNTGPTSYPLPFEIKSMRLSTDTHYFMITRCITATGYR